MLKLKVGSKAAASLADSQQINGPSNGTSTPGPPVKLKLSVSQPPTPIEQPVASGAAPGWDSAAKTKRSYVRKDGDSKKSAAKKRAADDDGMSPAAKRIASGATRKLSLKPPVAHAADGSKLTKISLPNKRTSLPKFVDLRARGKAPPRPKGVGYDSEDSDTEKDPAVQQAVVLRMEPGEDADYLREAIQSNQIGPHPTQGDAEVSIKFIEKNYRRAVIKIKGRMYGAVLVDLPCIVESMKSFDKKGWWKVADMNQMLLVLGRCQTEEEARTLALPKEVNKDTMQFAHGLTPPMHWVRKRRFRKRLNYTQVQNVEEEVNKLIEADAAWERGGGTVTSDHTMHPEQSIEPNDYEEDEDAEGDGEVFGSEQEEGDFEEDDLPAEDLEAQMQAMFDDDQDDGPTSDLIAESPAPLADQAASMTVVDNTIDEFGAIPFGTPADTGMTTQDDEDDESEDESEEDDNSPDLVDEDALAKAAERAQQLEEVADLEREVERARQKVKVMTNQLLRAREMQKLAALEEDLRVKKGVFGLDAED